MLKAMAQVLCNIAQAGVYGTHPQLSAFMKFQMNIRNLNASRN
jgi:hypothetical protein